MVDLSLVDGVDRIKQIYDWLFGVLGKEAKYRGG
jgi:hypothetical protein